MEQKEIKVIKQTHFTDDSFTVLPSCDSDIQHPYFIFGNANLTLSDLTFQARISLNTVFSPNMHRNTARIRKKANQIQNTFLFAFLSHRGQKPTEDLPSAVWPRKCQTIPLAWLSFLGLLVVRARLDVKLGRTSVSAMTTLEAANHFSLAEAKSIECSCRNKPPY